MATAIEQLLVLQACDQEIRRLQRELADIPQRKQQIESRLNAHKDGLAQAEANLLGARTRIKQHELDIESGKQHIQKLRDQQLQIKSNESYKALEREIASTQAGIRKSEDQVLEAMEVLEVAEADVSLRRDALEKERVRMEEDIQTFVARGEELAGELSRKEEERKAQAQTINPSWLARYERLFAKFRDAAIALVERSGSGSGGTCGCCHMALSPAKILDARKLDTLTLCDHCGRMLYLNP